VRGLIHVVMFGMLSTLCTEHGWYWRIVAGGGRYGQRVWTRGSARAQFSGVHLGSEESILSV